MFSARALYNNSSESPEELTFNQGDVLTVIQRDFNGLSGWWLCFHDGRVGLAPGNRLRILSHVGLDDGVPTGSEQQAQQPVPAGGGVGASRDEQEQRRERQQIIKVRQNLNVGSLNMMINIVERETAGRVGFGKEREDMKCGSHVGNQDTMKSDGGRCNHCY